MTNFTAMNLINKGTPKVGANHEHLSNKAASVGEVRLNLQIDKT
jgi:hypothetical protein